MDEKIAVDCCDKNERSCGAQQLGYQIQEEVVTIGSVMDRIGSFGLYQKFMVLLLCIPFMFNWTLNYWVHYMILLTPPHHCSIPGVNSSVAELLIPRDDLGQLDQCHRYNVSTDVVRGMNLIETTEYLESLEDLGVVSCDAGWDFDLKSDFRTAVVDHQWVCDNQWKKYTTQTLFFAGMLVGLILFGVASDHYGRLPVCIVTNLLAPIAGVLCVFCPSFYSYSAIRFFMGLTENSVFMMPFIIVMEYLPPASRGLVSPLAFAIFPALVNGSLPWVALLIGDWKMLLVYGSILCVFLAVPAFFFMPESASWLLTHGKVDACKRVMQRIAKFNGNPLEDKEVIQIEDELNVIKKHIESQPTPNLRQIIKSTRVCIRFVVCVLLSMVIFVLYDATIRNLELIPASSYVTFTLSAIIFLPSQMFAGFVMNRFGRKATLIISFIMSSALNAVVAFVPLELLSMYVLATLLLSSHFFNVASYSVNATLMSELLPTVIRARCVALITCAAACALTVSPQIILLGTHMPGLPSIIFAVLAVIGALLTLLIPETNGKPLPQTLEDGERLGREDEEQKSEQEETKKQKC